MPLTQAAREAQVPLRTAQRWLVRYRAGGLAALARPERSDRGVRRLPEELARLVEGLALRRPRPSVPTVARQAAVAATEHGWPAPSYSTVHAIVAALDPHLVTLAHDGPTALRDCYELVYAGSPIGRTRCGRPTTPSWTCWFWTPTSCSVRH